MTNGSNFLRPTQSRQPLRITALAIALAIAGTLASRPARARTLDGTVESNATGLQGYRVSLFAAYVDRHDRAPDWRFLGAANSDTAGDFHIHYKSPSEPFGGHKPLLFVEAVRGPVMLASAIGALNNVVVNERTTVATGNAFAQFVHGWTIEGNTYGMINAVHMVGNLVDPRTGEVGKVLASLPNGDTATSTSTLATFNSLANAVASCVAVASDCAALFTAATPPGGPPPTNVLQALANIVKNPSYVEPDDSLAPDDPLFDLSQQREIYTPFLTERPTNWLLFLKITGGFYSAQNGHNLMNGPGNFAIDARGFAWVNDNYVPRQPDQFACAGRRLMKFFPWGKKVPGSPYFGGGLSGAGYGITLDPKGNVWVGNFGFQDPPCAKLPQAATQNSVSIFRPDGTPISPANGFTQGGISWPQGTVSDRDGNIWLANCGNDTVTRIPHGNPHLARNIQLGVTPPEPGHPHIKPFGIAFDRDGDAWVADNLSSTMSVISPRGNSVETLPSTYRGKTVLRYPVGDAADTQGNIWVANSDYLNAPCPTRVPPGPAAHPSTTMYQAKNHKPYPGSPFTGGGLTLPWGIAVDGDDTVWVFNFGAKPLGPQTGGITGISRFCGINTKKCPPGFHVGRPISPDTGYQSDALQRVTGAEIDPSGNIWITNNWKIDANPLKNPGGNAIVIAIGAAGPLKTPLIGPPVSFEEHDKRDSSPFADHDRWDRRGEHE